MATLQINMENGFFTCTNGRYVTEVTPTHVAGNGWNCAIREDGSVLCEAVRDYSDGVHSMRYEIAKNGFAKLTLKVGNEPVRTIRKGFVLPCGAKLTDGVIGLAGGYVDERYAYFRDASFQRFLNKFGITAVKHEDPNRTFVVRNARYGGGECRSNLVSDGIMTEICYDSGRTEGWNDSCPGTCAYEGETSYEVTGGATWVIHTQDQDEGDCHNYARILYTQARNVADLESSLMGNKDIAMYVLKREQIARLHSLDKRVVSSVDDIREVVRQVIEIAPKMKSKLDDSKAEEFLHCFDLTGGYQYKVETWGPMPNNPYADFEIRIACGNGDTQYGRILMVAEGDLG